MYFSIKNTLKNNYNHTSKHTSLLIPWKKKNKLLDTV